MPADVDDEYGGEPACLMPLLDEQGTVRDAHRSVAARIQTKRIYEPAAEDDGYRVLVDRLWPRGVRKEGARLDAWMKDIAPSDELRRWYGHEVARWDEFRRRYRTELTEAGRRAQIAQLVAQAHRGPLTLLYGAHDPLHNNATVLRDVLIDALADAG